MKPVKIVISGDYWDCHIYRGRLYLWHSNGSLRIINWHELVGSLTKNPAQRLALTCAFLQGRFLYASNLSVLFEDSDFKYLLTQKFRDIVEKEYVIGQEDLEQFTMSVQDNPFHELQTDSEIINNKIFALTYQGLFWANAHRPSKNKYLVSKKPEKVNDFVGFSLKAGKYGRLALSGGDEGLYEYDVVEDNFPFQDLLTSRDRNRMNLISTKHSSFADFSFLSLYNSSVIGSSFLSLFKLEEGIDFKYANTKKHLEKEIRESEIFGSNDFNSLSWGSNEKLYKASNNILEVVNFNNYAKDENYFSKKNVFQFQAWKGKIIKGGNAYFGTIIECENAIVVLTGEKEFFNIPGSATRWRVYPRSFNYENHLHVIKDDRLEIYSFNNDYFRDQYDKNFGIRFTEKFKVKGSSF